MILDSDKQDGAQPCRLILINKNIYRRNFLYMTPCGIDAHPAHHSKRKQNMLEITTSSRKTVKEGERRQREADETKHLGKKTTPSRETGKGSRISIRRVR